MAGWALPVLALLSACGDDSPPESAAPISSLVLDSTPFLQSTAPDPDSAVIQSVRWATRLPNGGVVIADQYAARLVFLDSTGSVYRTTGRRGEGPGEFGNPFRIDRCGTDSLFVWDYTRRTIIVTDTAGSFAREFRPAGAPWELTCSASGWFAALGLPREFLPPSADDARSDAPLWTMDRTGERILELPDVPIGDNRSLGRETRIAAARTALFVGTADSAWVDRFPLAGPMEPGTQVGGVRIGIEGRTPTSRQFDDAIEALVAITPIERGREIQRRGYREIPPPDELPPYRHLFVDPDDLLWAVVSAPGDSITRLQATTPSGAMVFDGSLPGPLRVFEIGRDYVLGATADALGRESIVMYRLTRGPV
ncbi:NHL repeat-containing protein [Gaopeijia maritima]|uniref:6-bladed beta-propeller n=1 Tax=Gaopeijia maritima TaxID=3119007 RepID=A0ABU9EDY8_9BACT